MSELSDFFTREKANEGIEVPLYLPDGGESEHKLTIRGVDSDAFRQAETEAKRRALELAADGKEPEDGRLALLAPLVAAWTFDEPCTPDNVRRLLKEAPQIADAVDRIAVRRSLFFAARPSNSKPSPSPKSGSRSVRKARRSADSNT